MRIFLVLHPSGNHSVPGSMTWHKNFYETLIDLNHDVFYFRLDKFCVNYKLKYRSEAYKNTLSVVLNEVFKKENNKKPFDIFFSYLTVNDILPGGLQNLRNNGVLMVNFSCNNTHQFYLVKDISQYFDFNLHSEKYAKCKFEAIGANSIWFQMAANPKYYFPVSITQNIDVSFIGANYAKRAYYIYYLLENGINVQCYGPNWLINKPNSSIKTIYKELARLQNIINASLSIDSFRRYKLSSKINYYDFQKLIRKRYFHNLHLPIEEENMLSIFNHSKINLGFLEVFSSANDSWSIYSMHIHLREFEVPMSRGLYITNYSDELAELFEPDKEVLVYRNEYELKDKIMYYLKNPQDSEKIRHAGFERSIKCHTYQIRFTELFKKMNII